MKHVPSSYSYDFDMWMFISIKDRWSENITESSDELAVTQTILLLAMTELN